jgi:hypothetical protein
MKTPTYEEMHSVKITSQKQAREYLNKKIWFLRSIDIDKSGRGYYFPRFILPVRIEKDEFIDKTEHGIRYSEIQRLKIVD